MELLCSSGISGLSLHLAFGLATVMLMFSPLLTKSHDDTSSNLLTGLDIAELSSVRDSLSLHFLINNSSADCLFDPWLDNTIQKVDITGTVYNPRRYELRFEAVSALLSLFELQEKIHSQFNSKSGNGMLEDLEDFNPLTSVEILLDSVIQDSCNYVSVTICDLN